MDVVELVKKKMNRLDMWKNICIMIFAKHKTSFTIMNLCNLSVCFMYAHSDRGVSWC